MGKIYRPSVGYNYNSWRGTAARCRKERSNSNWITLFVFVRLQYATTVTDNLKKIEIMKLMNLKIEIPAIILKMHQNPEKEVYFWCYFLRNLSNVACTSNSVMSGILLCPLYFFIV